MQAMKKKRVKYVKICPRCGSVKVGVDFSNPVVWNFGTSVKYQCKSCRHIATIFPEVPLDKVVVYQQKFREGMLEGLVTLSDEDKVDTKTGYSVGVYLIALKFLIPVILLVLIGFIFLSYLF